MTSLIVVDVQNDFCEDGALPVEGGNAVAERIASFLYDHFNDYEYVVFSQDWHDAPPSHNGGHFSNVPDYVNTWPVHCVAETYGAEFHSAILEFLDSDVADPERIAFIRKGQGKPAYSAFEGTATPFDPFKSARHKAVHICGLAYDYCVKETAVDAVHYFPTIVLADLTASVARYTEIRATSEMSLRGVGVSVPL